MNTKPKLIKMKDVEFDKSIFNPMKTGGPIDYMFSQEGGIFPATNYMLIGDPVVGKSTLGLDIASNIKRQARKKVLFICAEMNRIDMHDYVVRYPKFGEVDVLFLGEYVDHNPKKVVEDILNLGFDLVLTDSFIEVQETVSAFNSMSRLQSEKWLIDLMISNNLGNNKPAKYTSFLMIQQVTKGGEFAGSNKLKHNTTGMCELRFSDGHSGERFISFSKNRRGGRYEKLFFSLDSKHDVSYDEKRLKRDQEIKNLIKKENENLEEDEKTFARIFGDKPILEVIEDNKPVTAQLTDIPF